MRGSEYIKIWCFAEEADVQKFIARFGDEMIDPGDRPRWPGKVWKTLTAVEVRSMQKGPGRIWDWTEASNGVCLENFSLNCFGLAVELF